MQTCEPIPRGRSFDGKPDICVHHNQSEVLSGLGNESCHFPGKCAGSLPRHFCDKGWDCAAWYQTLRKNAQLIYKTGDHKSPAAGQGVSHDVLGQLIDEAKLSISVFRFPVLPMGKNPAGAERDHTHSARSEFLLKPQRETC